MLLSCASAQASATFPALGQDALSVRYPERNVLQAAAMAGTRVVAAGEHGIVVLSDDGGRNWRQAARVPVAVTLTALQFVDARQGWAVGHGGVILHTNDGGNTWQRQTDGTQLGRIALDAATDRVRQFPADRETLAQLEIAKQVAANSATAPLLDLWFVDASHGFVVGAYNQFFETTDGGKTWTSAADRLVNPKGLHLYSIRARGDVVLISGEQGLLLRSRDGARHFRPLSSPYEGSWFSSVFLSDREIVIAGLRGNAFYSSDAGESWTRFAGAGQVSFSSAVALANGAVLLSNQAGQCFVGFMGGRLTLLDVPPQPPLSAVLPLDAGDILALGAAGVLRLALPSPPSRSVAR
ncbi:Ycf48-like protein precursor [Pandoraea pulmonicola]|nr:Ycf48-like protein precursor [Pandoraea pulmonicola]